MRRPGKPERAEDAKALVTTRPRKSERSRVCDLEKRLAEAVEQQTATSEILRVISRSQTDAQPVFDAIAANAAQLCGATDAIIRRVDGNVLRLVAHHGLLPGVSADSLMALDRASVMSRAVVDRQTVHIDDLAAQSYGEFPVGRDLAKRFGYRTVLATPLLRDGVSIGVIGIRRLEVRPFSDKQIKLLETFADQAAIAIENVRLFNETREALEQQTATSEILRVISQSPTDVQPVFDTIANAAFKLCNARSVNVLTFDGELLHVAALVTATADGARSIRDLYPRPASYDQASTRAVLTRKVVMVPDVSKDREFKSPEVVLAAGFRSVLAVPLMRNGSPIGAIAVGRPEAGEFPGNQVALLRTFADQAVIAIENARLFNETKEALDQQTATSEILRVISQSRTDVQPVFEAIASAALRLCGATLANVFRFDGELLHLAVVKNVHADQRYFEAIHSVFPRAAGHDSAVGRAVLTRSIVAIPDVMEDKEYGIMAQTMLGGFRSILGVPLMREDRAIGGITVCRQPPGQFSESQVALLKTFAEQAVIAVENVRLFTELEARTAQLTRSVSELRALGEVGQAVSSTLDLETVLATIVSRATALTGMDGGAIYEYDEARGEFYLHTADRLPDEVVTALRAGPIPKGEGALGRMAMTGDPTQIQDIMTDASYQSRLREVVLRLGFRSLMAVPLMRDDHLLGGLVVYRKTPGEFDAAVIDLLGTFATQSALAIQNAQLFRQIAEKSRELETASKHKSEFLANMSHELRTPLNAILGFSEVLSERMFGEINEKQAEYLNDILESGRHLLSLINDILDLSKIEAGRMELEATDFDLPSAIENTLSLIRERAHRRAITLARNIDQRLAMIRGDERKVKQVLLNLLSNALKFTPEGGQIGVRAEFRDGAAEISVTDTGVGIAPEDQEAVFEEFRQVGTASKKVEGTGLGLAISRKFIELHGGKIWVKSQVGLGSTFAFTLPLQ
jgi:signal transduction histidine kinase